MELLLYIAKVGIIFTAFFLVYFLMFRNNTYFQLNRIYLLSIVPLAFVLPLADFSVSSNVAYHITLPAFEYNQPISSTMSFSWKDLLLFGFVVISFKIFVQFIANLINTLKTIDSIKKGAATNVQPFSFFGFIYVSKNIPKEDRQAIYIHEKTHASQLHSLDIMVYEISKIVLWWNPFLWIGVNAVKSNHEFIADKLASEKADNYSSVLVAQLLGVNCSLLTNNFKSKPLIKKRIMMMKTKKSNRFSVLKYTLVVPVIGLTLMATTPLKNTANTKANVLQQNTDKVYEKVDVMPEFKGGKEGLMNYLIENIKYPKEAKSNKIEGTVFVQFIVNAKGKVQNVNVPKSVHHLLDKEAIRVIAAMPKWTPGKKEGKAVSVQYTLPIAFKL